MDFNIQTMVARTTTMFNVNFFNWLYLEDPILIFFTFQVIIQIMKKEIRSPSELEEAVLRIKREGQEKSRQLVRDGIRTQESMFLIPPAVAKASKVCYRGL